jgi:hypothetical protein
VNRTSRLGVEHADDETMDVFVSYAHADDAVPPGARLGWVSTLVESLRIRLQQMLGGVGASICIDHDLPPNHGVTGELHSRIRRCRTLLLVMSPGYTKSDWCQRELSEYVDLASKRGNAHSVFLIEIAPTDRNSWHPAIRSLTPIKFWHRPPGSSPWLLKGFPTPKADEDSPYWTSVNDLAHWIASRLQAKPAVYAAPRKSQVVVAETTEDLEPQRQKLVSALAQRGGVVIRPSSSYPRSVVQDYIARVRNDLDGASLFVQLLGSEAGERLQNGQSFVLTQAHEARARRSSVPLMQWRSPETEVDAIADQVYRQLLVSEHVSCLSFERFLTTVLRALDESVQMEQRAGASSILRIAPPERAKVIAPELDGSIAEGLSLYLQAAPEDRETAADVRDRLLAGGATVLCPEPGQDFQKKLQDQEAALPGCDGVVLLYGRCSARSVEAAFLHLRRVFGIQRSDIWCAVLDLPPVPPGNKQDLEIHSRNLLNVQSREGFELNRLAEFFAHLHTRRRAALSHA